MPGRGKPNLRDRSGARLYRSGSLQNQIARDPLNATGRTGDLRGKAYMTPDVSGQIESASGLDIFGDIHGHLAPLERALEQLGYIRPSDGWKPPDGRLALFLGDLIDRGPDNRKVIDTVRTMTTRGDAICLMGNHELNAIHFATENPEFQGRYLRPRSNKNLRQQLPSCRYIIATRMARLRWQRILAGSGRCPCG